jgi:hypothetical protein
MQRAPLSPNTGRKPMRETHIAMVAFSLALTGCVAQQQQQALQETSACLQAAYNLPEAAPMRARTPFDINDATLTQLAETSLADKPETDAILTVNPRFRACQNQVVERLRKLAPTAAPLIARFYRDHNEDVLALVQRKMTWGDFNKRRRDRALAGQEKLVEEDRRLAAEDEARAQDQAERRRADTKSRRRSEIEYQRAKEAQDQAERSRYVEDRLEKIERREKRDRR